MLQPEIFVYGISDRKVGGLDVQTPDGNVAPVFPEALGKNVAEAVLPGADRQARGTRMHHKFVVIDSDKPTARVYLGSYNFSTPADTLNGENLLLIATSRVAIAYIVEAAAVVRPLRVPCQQDKPRRRARAGASQAAASAREKPWWDSSYTIPTRSAIASSSRRRLSSRAVYRVRLPIDDIKPNATPPIATAPNATPPIERPSPMATPPMAVNRPKDTPPTETRPVATPPTATTPTAMPPMAITPFATRGLIVIKSIPDVM